MEELELVDSIEAIIDKEELDQRRIISVDGKQRTPWTLSTNQIDYPHVELLIDIFSITENNPSLKDPFIRTLQNTIATEADPRTPLPFYALVKLNFTKQAITALDERRLYGLSSDVFLAFLIDLFKEENQYFTNLDLNEILKILSRLNISPVFVHLKDELMKSIIIKRFENVELNIKRINVEINQDKKTVIKKIRYLGFEDKYAELLIEIDRYIYGDTPRIVNSGMIGNLRAFLEGMIIDLSKKISIELQEEIPKLKDKSDLGNRRVYLKQKLDLSDHDHELIDAFVQILHDEGGHAFLSEKEYFRLSKNMVIEITLLLLSRYESLNKLKK